MGRRIVKLVPDDEIVLYNWEETRLNVRSYFSKYRIYLSKVNMIKDRYTSSLGNDNMGIYSSTISDPTANKVEQMEKYNNYIDLMNKHLEIVKKNMTADEKIILKKSILDNFNDEDLSEALNISRSHIYQRKKSCYIKVARYFDLEVEKDIDL